MTKEIAIHNLFALKLRSRVTSDREALDMAIKALEQQPSYNSVKSELKPCEDAISREAVIRLVEQYPNIIGNRFSGLIADIKHLPSVTPQPKRGKWIEHEDGGYDCSNCCEHFSYNHYHYCPCCGSQNREVEDE